MVSYEFGENSDGEGGLLTLSVYDETGNKTHTALNPQATGGVYNIGGDCIVTENTYDADSNLISSKDAEGIKTEFSYNQEGQLTKVKQPGNTVTSFAYSKGLEGGGSKVTTTDAKGNKSSVKTSARGLDESITDYIEGETAGIKRTFQYDGEGNVVKEKELEGNYKTYAYDDKGRNTEIKYHKADGTETLKSTFEYNINDEIILMQDYEKTDGNWNLYRSEKYTYDALNRMVSYKEWNGAQEPEQPTASYTYDIEGNVTRVDYSDPDSDLEALIFTYSGSKKLLKIKADTGKLLNDTVREYEYDEQGRVSLIKDHYDFAGNGSYLEKSYTYDSFGRVTSMTYKGGSSHNDVKEAYTYTYDKNSNITSEHIVSNYSTGSSGDGTDKTREYTYDSLGRLVETNITDNKSEDDAETITYTYDAAGNRLTETKGGKTVSYTYNGLNQLTEAAETGNLTRTYSYDSNGNQSVEVTKEGDSETLRRTFAYDEGNRLKKLTVKEGETVTLTQENRYNGDGQRIRKKETKPGSGTGGDPAEVKQTDYFYQDGAVLYTEDANGNRTSMNLLGGSGNIIATSRTAGNTENWYLYNKDIRESTSSITGADGNPAATYEYDDFGNTEITGGADFYNEICYTGQVYDVSSGLYYYNARYYDPNNGRFITQDTYRGESSTPDTLHLYAYCANNPINYVDPSGHVFESLYSKLTKRQKDKLTSYQRNALKEVPSKNCHFKRNDYNKDLPATRKEARKKKWKYSIGSAAHQFNQKVRLKREKEPNVKYKKGHKEVIFYCDGTKNDTPEDRGSYNYDSGTGDSHTLKDVVSWVAWGNSSTKYGNKGNDRTTPKQRLACTPQAWWRDKPNQARIAIKNLNMYKTVRN